MKHKPKYYLVIAGMRRMAALKEIQRGNGDPRIACVLCDVDADIADALSQEQTLGRQKIHLQDEGEAFARLAKQNGMDANAIAA